MQDLIRELTFALSTVAEGIAAIVIGLAMVEALARPGIAEVRRLWSGGGVRTHDAGLYVRLRLGRALTLALEFLLAADILRTAVAPSWSEIGKLAAIAAIRTALNFFLEQEIDRVTSRESGDRGSKGHTPRNGDGSPDDPRGDRSG